MRFELGRIDGTGAGERARKMREAAGLSLSKVAHCMEITQGHLSHLERSGRNWNEAMARRFENALTELGREP